MLELLVKLASLECAPTELSDESAKTLWNGKDSVLMRDEDARDAREDAREDARADRKDAVYVILRHFTTDGLGTHVGLSAVRKHAGGEVHEYRMPAATLEGERVGVYVYNPGVYANGTLRFAVDSCLVVVPPDTCPEVHTLAAVVVVPPDTCPEVHTLAAADMQQTRTVVLTEETRRYSISLSFFFMRTATKKEKSNAQKTKKFLKNKKTK